MQASVLIDGERFAARAGKPFVFGRQDAPGVVGLDPNDMGISAVAGSIEWDAEVCWVVNRSRKRRLLIDDGTGGVLHRLECGLRWALTSPSVTVVVPGAIYTHRIDLQVPPELILSLAVDHPSSGTITDADVDLSEKDRVVVVGLCSGYLREFPRRNARPLTYREVAELLGEPWTKLTVRKQLERFKAKLARSGVYFDGPQANYDLADWLIGSGLLSLTDLERLPH